MGLLSILNGVDLLAVGRVDESGRLLQIAREQMIGTSLKYDGDTNSILQPKPNVREGADSEDDCDCI